MAAAQALRPSLSVRASVAQGCRGPVAGLVVSVRQVVLRRSLALAGCSAIVPQMVEPAELVRLVERPEAQAQQAADLVA